MTFLVAAILILSPPSPELCRQHGVAVKDGDTPTGEIVASNRVKRRDVPSFCQGQRGGCAMAVWPGYNGGASEWVIIHSDEYSERHEICHALYEVRDHTEEK